MAEELPRKKTVRFDLANLELRPELDLEAPHATAPHERPVQMGIDPPTDSGPEGTQSTPDAKPEAYTTLLDADTSLATPLDEIPASPHSRPGSSPTTSPPTTPAASRLQFLSAPTSPMKASASYATFHDTNTSFTTPTPAPSHHLLPFPPPPTSSAPSTTPTNIPQTPSTSTLQMHISPSAISLDAGETDAHGTVLQASTEACEKCGGRVVWATKGEWLLVCEGCGDVQ